MKTKHKERRITYYLLGEDLCSFKGLCFFSLNYNNNNSPVFSVKAFSNIMYRLMPVAKDYHDSFC